MKLTFEQAENWFGPMMWHSANRSVIGMWDRTDVYHELLTLVVTEDFPPVRTKSIVTGEWLPVNPAMVNRFIHSRSIDIIRKEKTRRHGGDAPLDFLHKNHVFVTDPERVVEDQFGDTISDDDKKVIRELAFPSVVTITRAYEERESKKKDANSGRLRMNVRGDLQVLPRHVADSMGISLFSVRKAIARSRRVLSELS